MKVQKVVFLPESILWRNLFSKRLQAGKIESIVFPLIEMIKEIQRSVGAVVIGDGCWYDVVPFQNMRS